MSRNPQQLLQRAQIYLLVAGGDDLATFRRQMAQFAEAGVDVIQLRDKNRSDQELLQLASALVAATRGTDTLSIINDRTDLALAAGADGVHLGQDDLPLAEARRLTGPALLIGQSTHSKSQALRAMAAGADYIGVGPTFPSTTKRFTEFTGEALLRQVARSTTVPAFAIGGITLENVPAVLTAGFSRVAVAGAICRAESPLAAVAAFRRTLARTWK